ncbi:MAG: antitoxin family protein [Aureliella sp.]
MSQMTNRAIVKNGQLEPIHPISLPEGTEVIFTAADKSVQNESEEAAQLRIFASLARTYETGQTDLAERHNEPHP